MGNDILEPGYQSTDNRADPQGAKGTPYQESFMQRNGKVLFADLSAILPIDAIEREEQQEL